MKVYIVEAGWHYDGGDIEGVFSTPQKAQDKANDLEASGDYQYVVIGEFKVE